jgi:hypothetical protein
LSAGVELCSFACDKQGPAARAPLNANAKHAFLNIVGNPHRKLFSQYTPIAPKSPMKL